MLILAGHTLLKEPNVWAFAGRAALQDSEERGQSVAERPACAPVQFHLQTLELEFHIAFTL